jgi:creatinine amidohydrolase
MTAELNNFTSDMSWDVYAQRIQDGAVVLVPVGAHEQHGHHMSLGTDNVEVTEVCRRVSTHIDAVVTPTIPFGYKSQPRSAAGNHWPGNIALSGGTLVSVVRDVLVAIGHHGASRIAVIDAHYENGWFLVEACDLAAQELERGDKQAQIVRMLCWDAIPEKDWSRVYEVSGPMDLSLAHAGVLEAAAMMHIAPECVDLSREPEETYPTGFDPYDVYPADPKAVPASGALSSPKNSTADLGKFIVETMSWHVARLLSEAFGCDLAEG